MHYVAFGCLAVVAVFVLFGLLPLVAVIWGMIDAIFSVMF